MGTRKDFLLNKIIKNFITVIICALLSFVVYFALLSIFGSKTPIKNTQQQTNNSEVKKQIKKKKKVNLFALGDSLTQGVGDSTNNGGYVYLIQQKLQKEYTHLKVLTNNFGKSGDRSDQILARLQESKEMQKELKSADIIVLTVGGNDLMQTLQKNFNSLSSDELAKVMPSAKKTYAYKLNNLLQSIRIYNANAPVFIFEIYNPFFVYFPRLTQLQKYTNEWNNTTRQVIIKKKGMHLVQINKQLSEGQYIGKTAQLKTTTVTDLNSLDGNKLAAIVSNKKEKNDYLSAYDHFHPNLKGYNYMTEQLYKKMINYKNSWLNKVNK
ncbi:lipase acylhydrolase [Liquorilactobacillus cacaonum DSM 21116]|uniref:Lipase acylhydrolase n=1 Tax=Liquorilactobacillus cacaonum DSM 21116 TaxID=1423729 RepID=A0A0R2CHM0_9LACO|nr:lipase acylhydrolase [Liquorilactobacillus cacaonum DSM 21116]